MDKEEIEGAKLEIAKERARTEREKFFVSYPKYTPLATFIGALLVCGFHFFNEPVETWLLAWAVVGIFASGFCFEIQSGWEKALEAKAAIADEDVNYKFSPRAQAYDENEIGFDSTLEYNIFRLLKLFVVLTGLAVIAVAAALLFSMVSSISVSPTSVIIFMLIMISIQLGNLSK